jgi:hypothetical protein
MDETSQTPQEQPAGEGGAEATILAEFQELGQRLAAALRAATETPEADALKSDVREGMQQLRHDIDSALANAPVPGRGRVPEAGNAVRTMRNELAGALRGLNRTLERMAGALEPAHGAADAGPEQQAAQAGGAGTTAMAPGAQPGTAAEGHAAVERPPEGEGAG